MVKQAERKRKRNPLLPVFGIALALVFGFFAYVLMDLVQPLLVGRVSFGTMDLDTVRLLIGVVIWFVLFGTTMFLVAILAGRGVDEAQAIKFAKQVEQDKKMRAERKKYRRR